MNFFEIYVHVFGVSVGNLLFKISFHVLLV